jgi:hypothetical protein
MSVPTTTDEQPKSRNWLIVVVAVIVFCCLCSLCLTLGGYLYSSGCSAVGAGRQDDLVPYP